MDHSFAIKIYTKEFGGVERLMQVLGIKNFFPNLTRILPSKNSENFKGEKGHGVSQKLA